MKRIIQKMLAVLCAGCMLTAFSAPQITRAADAQSSISAAASAVTEQSAYQAITAMKSRYPEGTSYNNNRYYAWKGGIFSGGYGCAGFAFEMSDAAFGSLPARYFYDYSKIRVGDILRVENNSHSVIVLEIRSSEIVVAEGNYNGKVHWGRTIPLSEIRSSKTAYGLTRYPELLRGDVDGSNSVSAKDAQLALIAYTKLFSQQGSGLSDLQFSAADANRNGTLDARDPQLILMYYVSNSVSGKSRTWEQLIG